VTAISAATLPGPPELLPGRPDAIIDLQTHEGAALVGGQWRYGDAEVAEIDFVGVGPDLGPSGPPNRTYDVVPHAQAVDFDDSGWQLLAPPNTERRLGGGRVCFAWYRIDVTIPERVGDLDPTGSTAVFEVVVDDYAEVWVNGGLPLALGQRGGQVVGGFNTPNRVVLGEDVRPGQQFQIAVFAMNGPVSASPANYIWIRSATVDLYAPERARAAWEVPFELYRADPAVDAIVPARSASSASPAASSSPRARCGPATARCCSAPRTPTPSTAGRRPAWSRCSARRAATPAWTSAATASRAPTG
jgi:gluconolactonase